MKVLAVLANYGTKNDRYMLRLVEEYRAMSHRVDIIVLSNTEKRVEGADVIVRRPKGNPWSFPFAHREILSQRRDGYDVFIYSEDDTLIRQGNIDAFLSASQQLPIKEIAGFMRSEERSDGTRFISTVHSHFHWDPKSVVCRGGALFAAFTNEHGGCYMLTRQQLGLAIRSGGFLVPPHSTRYDLLVSAATDPYTQCGFRKLVCISEIDRFILPHLANKYVGKLGVSEVDLRYQIGALQAIHDKRRPRASILPERDERDDARCPKSYYEPALPEIRALVPPETRTLLSYGCGWGAMEESLQREGVSVTAVPLDAVIGACAEARGIEVVRGNSEEALLALSGRRFDCILVSNLLHLLPQPVDVLAWLRRLLSPVGVMVATIPNTAQVRRIWREAKLRRSLLLPWDYPSTGIHQTSARVVRGWFKQSQFEIEVMTAVIPKRAQRLGKWSRLVSPWITSEYHVVARSKKVKHHDRVYGSAVVNAPIRHRVTRDQYEPRGGHEPEMFALGPATTADVRKGKYA